MRACPSYVSTIVLAVLAAVAARAALDYASQASRMRGAAAVADGPEDREALRALAPLYASQSDRVSLVAHAAFVLAIGAWICSLLRREPASKIIPLLPLIIAGIFLLLIDSFLLLPKPPT